MRRKNRIMRGRKMIIEMKGEDEDRARRNIKS
jgi:hypothetical protein